MIIKKCKICKKNYSCYPCQKRKYCSLPCAYKDPARWKKSLKGYLTKNRKTLSCKNCKKLFSFPVSQGKRIFCSNECKNKSCLIEKICRLCGKKFNIRKGDWRPGIFCSYNCKQKDWKLKGLTPESRIKISKTRHNNGTYSAKYQYSNCKNGKYDINGKIIYFRSSWEANYALYLNFLIKQKKIKKWEYETDTFWFEKIRRGVRSYKPDFKIFNNNGSFEYHEIKGWMDPKSKTKIKRMAKYYPTTKLIVVDSIAYKDIKDKIGRLLKFY